MDRGPNTASGEGRPIFSEPFFMAMIETSQDCIRVLSLLGEVEFMNARGRELFEIDDFAANKGKYWPSLWPAVSFELVDAAVKAAMRGEVGRFRAYCPTAKSGQRWWDTVVAPVRDPANGTLIALLATSRDVTAELDASAFLDAVIDNVPAVVLVKDALNGRFRLVNRAAEQAFGHSREEMLGKTDYDFFTAEEADFFRARDAEVIASGGIVVTQDEPATTKDQGVRFFRSKKVATYGPEGPRHLVCLTEDVTDEKQAAEALKAALAHAEAANSAKSEFLANMSHEIRTPLNGVVGVADVLSRTGLDPHQARMVQLIRESGQTLERLLSDVLDLARIESGHVDLQVEAMQVGDCARAVAALMDLRCREKDIRLVVEIAPEADTWAIGDSVRLKQVLTNLLNNAIKFTERGEVRLRVGPAAGRPGALRFEVQDTGVGFEPSVKAQIFGRFQQADGSITRRFGGTGLGLAISRQLVELMGGEIDCESTPGVGSTFFAILTFPPAPAPQIADTGPAASPDAPAGGVRILLADDHPTNRKVVELILDQAGVELVAVEDGRQALDAFRAEAFDLVLMDMQMPVMDGLTATRLIREYERQTGARRTPLVMLTANALPEHIRASLEAGADRHMSKPVTAAGLLETAAELIEAAASNDEEAAAALG